MPYLKIKVANNGRDNDWTTINDLTLDKATISNATITSVDNETSPTSKIEIAKGELKIGIGDEQKNLDEYLSLNTSGCTVGNTKTPGDYEYWGEKKPKEGDLYVQKKEVIQGEETITYSLLWYHNGSSATDGTQWTLMNAVWG